MRASIAFVLMMWCGVAWSEPYNTYQVTAYDSRSHQWTFINTYVDAKGVPHKKRMIVVCAFSKQGPAAAEQGPTACRLHVGQTFAHTPYPKDGEKLVDLWEMSPDRLAMIFGSVRDPEQWSQQFQILQQELIP